MHWKISFKFRFHSVRQQKIDLDHHPHIRVVWFYEKRDAKWKDRLVQYWILESCCRFNNVNSRAVLFSRVFFGPVGNELGQSKVHNLKTNLFLFFFFQNEIKLGRGTFISSFYFFYFFEIKFLHQMENSVALRNPCFCYPAPYYHQPVYIWQECKRSLSVFNTKKFRKFWLFSLSWLTS